MVLEILSGGELFDRIVKKGHYSERDASQLTSVIVKALGALHSVGILHRCVRAPPPAFSCCHGVFASASHFTPHAIECLSCPHAHAIIPPPWQCAGT